MFITSNTPFPLIYIKRGNHPSREEKYGFKGFLHRKPNHKATAGKRTFSLQSSLLAINPYLSLTLTIGTSVTTLHYLVI